MPRKKKESVEEPVVKKTHRDKRDFVFAVGRRREAVARVRMYTKGKQTIGERDLAPGDIVVNNKPISEYFSGETAKVLYEKPLKAVSVLQKYIFTVRVVGGGKKGQLDAVVHGISRALSEFNSEHRTSLKKKGLLTRDQRVRERRKVGTGGKARRQKQSPKR